MAQLEHSFLLKSKADHYKPAIYHIEHKIWVWFPVLIRGSFCTELVTWEHEACQMSPNQEGPLAGGCFLCTYTVISIRAI